VETFDGRPFGPPFLHLSPDPPLFSVNSWIRRFFSAASCEKLVFFHFFYPDRLLDVALLNSFDFCRLVKRSFKLDFLLVMRFPPNALCL